MIKEKDILTQLNQIEQALKLPQPKILIPIMNKKYRDLTSQLDTLKKKRRYKISFIDANGVEVKIETDNTDIATRFYEKCSNEIVTLIDYKNKSKTINKIFE